MSHNTESVHKAAAFLTFGPLVGPDTTYQDESVYRTQLSWQRYAASRRAVLSQNAAVRFPLKTIFEPGHAAEADAAALAAEEVDLSEYRPVEADEMHTQKPAGLGHLVRLQMAMRDQSEDRPTPRFIVVYMDGEPGRFSRLPWKVYDLWENPVMRGTQGRWSCATAREATELAVRLECKYA